MKKKFPSQIRYEENNPLICFRLKKHEKEKIRKMAYLNGESISNLVRKALLGLEQDFSFAISKEKEKSYQDGYQKGNQDGFQNGTNDGYDRGMNEWAIWVFCRICNKSLYVKPNSKEHIAIIDFVKGFFSHQTCPF
jgi:flagellar biosynthesis/type III secretory pathway protein FliH